MIAIYCWLHGIVQGHGIIILMVQLIHKIPNNFGLEVVGTLSLFIGICWFLAYNFFFLFLCQAKFQKHTATKLLQLWHKCFEDRVLWAKVFGATQPQAKIFMAFTNWTTDYYSHYPYEIIWKRFIHSTAEKTTAMATATTKPFTQYHAQWIFVFLLELINAVLLPHNKDTSPITQHMEIMLMK